MLERFEPDAERDVFLVTYPRSGTTWISCLAAELLFQISPTNLTAINSMVPDVHDLPEKSTVPAASNISSNRIAPSMQFMDFRHSANTARSSTSFVTRETLCCPIIATPGIYRITQAV